MKKLLGGISVSCNVWNKPNNIEQTGYLESQGYKVVLQGDDVRFWNKQVENEIEGVIRAIEFALKCE